MEIDQGIFLVQYKPFQSSLVQWARVFAVTLAAFPGVNNSNIVSDNLSVSRPAHYPTSLCSSEYGSRYSGCQSPGHKCSKSQGASSQFKLNHSLENHSLYSKQHPADWFQSSETEYHLKLAHAVSQVEISSETSSVFSVEVKTLAMKASEQESSQPRLEFHELMI